MNDTISAISTPRGEGGIGIVRLSGPSSLSIIKKIFQPRNSRFWSKDIITNTINYGHIVDPDSGEYIDEVLVSIMLAPRTYTREDVVEINCHGGNIPLNKVLELTLRMGARLAEPGEFTKRAFLNGRIDLTQAEAVIDIIRAKTDLCLKMAVNQLEGRLSKEIKNIRSVLVDALVNVEAVIDFPEDDLDILSYETIISMINSVITKLRYLFDTADEGKIITEGIKGVILGRPNVGKSSLFNALLRENRAIVTAIPGTTRDPIEEFINLDGIPLKLTDTAGIRKADDVIEIESIERTKMHLDQADIVILVLDATEGLMKDDKEIISLLNDKKTIIVINKIDLVSNPEFEKELMNSKPIVRISALNETGLDKLKESIRNIVFKKDFLTADSVFVTRTRHKKAIKDAIESLELVIASCKEGMSPEFIAVDLRGAIKSLGEIIGETTSSEILEQIFSRFCIGK